VIIILMGVSGAGKSTIGRRLAAELQWEFYEGDDFHTAENVAKMRRGEPLTDADRKPWLSALEHLIREALADNRSGVLACSALKQKYREQLMVDRERVHIVYLSGSYKTVLERLKNRTGHFMGAGLLKSQFDTLAEPKDVITVDINQHPEAVVAAIMQALQGMQMPLTTQILLDNLMFPEAPRWREGRLWFTDQHARRIVAVDMDGHAETVAEMDDLPGGLGWLPDGRLLVVAMTQRRIFQLTDSGLDEYADLSGLASSHCNDMLVEKQGRCYLGNFGFDLHGGAPQAPAELILVEPGGKTRIVAEGLVFPNGMVTTPDETTLIVAETFAARLTAFAIQADGSLANRRIWADLGDAYPDGICLDAENAVWVATPNAGEVLRVKEGGGILQRIKPRGTPYACMLGGPERLTLFIASSETDDPAMARQQKGGRIEVISVPVAGTGLP